MIPVDDLSRKKILAGGEHLLRCAHGGRAILCRKKGPTLITKDPNLIAASITSKDPMEELGMRLMQGRLPKATLPHGYASPYFVTNSDRMECQLENPRIIICPKKHPLIEGPTLIFTDGAVDLTYYIKQRLQGALLAVVETVPRLSETTPLTTVIIGQHTTELHGLPLRADLSQLLL